MNEAHDTDDQFDHWKALQRELGLSPAEPAPASRPIPRAEAPPPIAEPPEREPISAAEVGVPPPPDEAFPEPIDAGEPIVEEATTDMIEESLGEPAPGSQDEEEADRTGDKRRRRRRRRGRGKGKGREGEGEIAAAEPEAGPTEPVPATAAPEEPIVEEAPEEVEESAEPVAEIEEPVEPEPYADWNVPSWQELIGSLYRPDR